MPASKKKSESGLIHISEDVIIELTRKTIQGLPNIKMAMRLSSKFGIGRKSSAIKVSVEHSEGTIAVDADVLIKYGQRIPDLACLRAKFTDPSNSRPGAIAPLNTNFVDEFLNNPDGISIKRPYTAKPTSIKGYFKYTSVAGDSASVCVELFSGNTLVARGYFLQKSTVSTWTPFSAPIEYIGDYNACSPTHISIIVSSSAGYNFADLTNCKGQDGSTLWVDDLEFGF